MVLAMLVNVNQARGRQKKPAEFNRWPSKQTTTDPAEGWAALRALFKPKE